MRRDFADILKSFKIDITREYNKLFDLLHASKIPDGNFYSNLYSIFAKNFSRFRIEFKRTCISFQDFNDTFSFNFHKKTDAKLEDLLAFGEYIYNLLAELKYLVDTDIVYSFDNPLRNYIGTIFDYFDQLLEQISYKTYLIDGCFIFVEKDKSVIAVVESDSIPEEVAKNVLLYIHYSYKGDLQQKRSILHKLAMFLEGKQEQLKVVNNTLSKDLFFVFNNFNIRHNNLDSSNKSTYKPFLSEMSNRNLASIYDKTYRMCLLAVLFLEYSDFKNEINALKQKYLTQM